MEDFYQYFGYNSVFILSYFFISFIVFILNFITKDHLNKYFFSTYRSSPFNILTYVRLLGHSIGHMDWKHFMNNFTFILLIGPLVEEKYGTIPLLCMCCITSVVIGILNSIFSKDRIEGASGIVFMLIVLSSFVNIENGKIPITLILIFMFYIVDEILEGFKKKGNVSHLAHIVGAVCGAFFGFYFM